jgi:hypothetical protein
MNSTFISPSGNPEVWAERPDGYFTLAEWAALHPEPEPEPPSPEALAGAARARRDALLTASDWTQVNDSPLSPDERELWAEYRQALRDISDQPGFPQEIAWQAEPGAKEASND